ncbi:hypothetical protein HY227_01335 [Candidatus Wolfebacteria bacterium]|nr:hypothetical protein [Candidatus Wolfebacteria bacterium]
MIKYDNLINEKALRREKKKRPSKMEISGASVGTDLVINTSAIPLSNPEFEKAKKTGISVKSYPQATGELTKKYKTIALAGAHGKSTSTALASLVLKKAGFDPTVIIGTKLKEFKGSNFRQGKGNYLVLEADEYKGAFLNYHPFAAMITNIDKEHLDYYRNLADIKKTFLKFIGNIHKGGILVANKDDKNLFSLKNKIQKIAKNKNLRVFWYGIGVYPRIHQRLSALLKISGEHNISNALGVYVLAKKLGIKEKDILSALGSYRGAWRRMELRGELRIKNLEYRDKKRKKSPLILNSKSSILIYDDYAHHPTEIKATLSGIAQKWLKIGLICVFQPHQAKRLELLFNEFTEAFNDANALVLLDVFKVKGRDKVSHIINSQKLAEAIKKRLNQRLRVKDQRLTAKNVIYLPHSKNLQATIKKIIKYDSRSTIHDSWIIVMMGAGDIYQLTNFLVK